MKKQKKKYPKGVSKKFIKLENCGFPDCCIAFWVKKWIWTNLDSKFANDYWKKFKKYNPGYVPCPKCIKTKNFVDVQPCPKSCRLKRFILGNNWWKKSSSS